MTKVTQAQSNLASYKVDVSHSSVGFTVRHLMSRVRGQFEEFDGTILFDASSLAFQPIQVEIKATSIGTGNKQRDDHLRSADFFEVEKFPALKASSGQVSSWSGQRFQWTTDLTIRGVTKTVTFEMEFLGAGKDPWGQERIGFHGKAKVDRKDFGLTWNQALETGGVLVGSEVEIALDLEAVRA